MATAVKKTTGGNAAFRNYNNDFAHIKDPKERKRQALHELDNAKFGWTHFKACTIAGIGFFTDAYDIFAINMVTAMLGFVYWKDGHIPEASDTAIKVATSCGTVVGQLGFGWLADNVGRQKIYGFELIIMIFATLAQTLSSNSASINFVGLMVFWRAFMGIGIGGDYPLSSIITSEYANTKWRGAMMGGVFAMQGIGQLAAAICALIVTEAFKSQTVNAHSPELCDIACKTAVDRMWRIVVGFGAVPGCVALYYRLTMPETPRYQFDVNDIDEEKAQIDNSCVDETKVVPNAVAGAEEEVTIPKASWADFFRHYSTWKNGKILLGTAGSWFLLDVAFYGLGLNNSIILKQIGYSKHPNVYQTLRNNAVGNIILICAGSVPGYWVTVATVDTIGRKPIQLMGFIILTVLFFVIGSAFNSISEGGLLALYVLCQFFFNFGPNATTFIVPGECFPTRYRSTSHGISAASGKIGAILAQVLIGPLRTQGAYPGNESPWLPHVMQIFGGFMACGIFTSLLIPETKRKSLEQIGKELYDEGDWKSPEEQEREDAAKRLGETEGKSAIAGSSSGSSSDDIGLDVRKDEDQITAH